MSDLLKKIWDFLVWGTVLFPLLTGGIWSGEVSIPFSVLLVLGFFLNRLLHIDLKKTSSLRFCTLLWNQWCLVLKTSPLKTLWVGSGLFGFLWSFVSIRRHLSFQSNSMDLGIFVNAIWNLTHGNGYHSSVKNGINLLADHQSPIFWFLGPFFSLFPYPETLLILQAFILSSGAVALFLIGQQYLSKQTLSLFILPLLYWTYNPIRNACRFDFHPEVFMLPIFLFSIYGLQSITRKKRLLGFFLYLLALGCKESAGPIAVGIGAAWILGAGPIESRSFTKKIGWISIFFGLLTFYLDTKIIPSLFQEKYVYQSIYAQFGNSIWDIILSPLLQPALFLKYFLGKTRLKFLFYTLFPLSFLPLLNWRIFLGTLPAYFILFLSEGETRLNPIFHYGIESSVTLLWSLPFSILLAEKMTYFNKKNLHTILGCFILLAYGKSDLFYVRFFSPSAHHVWLRKEFLPKLSPESTFSVSSALTPHMANRPWVHHLPITKIPQNNIVDCIIYDPSVNNWPLTQEDDAKIKNGQFTQGYQMIYQHEKLQVWQRLGANRCFTQPISY